MKAYQNILVPIDFTPISASVLVRAKEIATCYKAKLTLLNVFKDIPLGNFGDTGQLGMTAEMKQEQMGRALEKLNALLERQDLPDNTEVQAVYTNGKASEAIIRFVKDNDMDLVIVGNSGKKSVLGFMGSTAEATLKGVPCDIMAVRKLD